MKYILSMSAKVMFLFIFIMSVITLLFIGVTSYYHPSSVIEFIEQLQPRPSVSPFTLTGVAVIGDSQSDEYRADDSRGTTYASTTLNWVELLAKYRKVNFGEWGVWSEPRRTGFSYNYARSGATANSMIISGQHSGVTEDIKEGKVNLVIIYIGANDFAPYITDDGYQAIYDSSITHAQILRKENLIIANIKTAVDTIRDAGNAKILLVKIPDWGNHIGVQVGFPFPDQRARVTTVIQETNKQLQSLADDYQLPTIDPNDFYKTVNENNTKNGIKIGDQVFTRLIPSDNPHSLVLEDGVHPGIVMNGLFANYIIKHLNSTVGTSIKEFSINEIFTAAGL